MRGCRRRRASRWNGFAICVRPIFSFSLMRKTARSRTLRSRSAGLAWCTWHSGAAGTRSTISLAETSTLHSWCSDFGLAGEFFSLSVGSLLLASRAGRRVGWGASTTLTRAEPLTTLPRSARSRVSWSLAECRLRPSPLDSLYGWFVRPWEIVDLKLARARNLSGQWRLRRRAIRALLTIYVGRGWGVSPGAHSRRKKPAGGPP